MVSEDICAILTLRDFAACKNEISNKSEERFDNLNLILNWILEHVTWKCSSNSQISLNVNMGVTWKAVAKRLCVCLCARVRACAHVRACVCVLVLDS